MKTRARYVLTAWSLVILAGTACAGINLGSTADVKYLTLQKGDIGEFQASFFNLGEDTLTIEFTAEHPKELRVEVYPEKLKLKPGLTDDSECEDCSFFVLKDGKTYVRTYPVYVYVKIPSSEISKNLYEIKLTATARDRFEDDASGIKQSLVQVREIRFNAYVPGQTTTKTTTPKETSKSGYENQNSADLKEEYKQMADARASVKDVSKSAGPAPSPGGTGQTQGANEQTKTAQQTNVAKTTQADPKTSGQSLIERDTQGKTKINLPTGNVVLSKEESQTAIDLGIITLTISVISLLARVLKS